MTAGQTTVIITNVGQTCLSYHTVPVCSHASVHTYVCVIAYACVFFFFWEKIKLPSASMLGGGNHTTNLPICPQQPWLIEYVRGDKSNQKTAESQSWGKSAVEERCVMVNVSVYLSAPCWVCVNGGGILAISSKASLPRETLINEPYLNIYELQGQDKE